MNRRRQNSSASWLSSRKASFRSKRRSHCTHAARGWPRCAPNASKQPSCGSKSSLINLNKPLAPPTRYYAHTLPGIEPIAWLEIRQRLAKAAHRGDAFAEEKNGIVLFDAPASPAQVLALRCVEDVFVLAAHAPRLTRDYKDLRAIAGLCRADAFHDALRVWLSAAGEGPLRRIRVVARKTGEHAYRRMDVEDAARGALQSLPGKWRWVEDDADLEVWVNVLGPLALIGLRLSDRGMRHRTYKTQHLPASLRPSAAAAMVLLSNPQPGDVFLDPMCGAGTLLAERAAAPHPARLILGGDISPAAAHAARRNTRLHTLRWDAGRLPIASASVDAIACNPPFGKKIGRKDELKTLYPAMLRECDRVLAPGGRAVFVTSAYELFRECMRHAPGLVIDRGYAVALLGEWGRIYVVKRRG